MHCRAFVTAMGLSLGGCQLFLVTDVPRDVAADGGPDDATSRADASVRPDPGAEAGSDASADADAFVDRPSYCAGITAHFPFDDSLKSTNGIDLLRVPSTPAPTFGPAHVGQGFLSNSAFTGILPANVGNTRVVDNSVGSIAVWIDSNAVALCPEYKIILQLQTSGTPLRAGPELLCSSGDLVLRNLSGTNDTSVFAPGYDGAHPNHIVITWRQSPPHLSLAINGTSVETKSAWSPQNPVADQVVVGFKDTPIDGYVDELTTWNRELDGPEQVVLANAQRGLAELCGL